MVPELTSQENLQRILAQNKIHLKKSSGQHFLICREAAEATVLATQTGPKQIIELGAGIGSLTQHLLSAGYHVHAIEKDSKIAHILNKLTAKHHKSQFTTINGDLRHINWLETINKKNPYQVVGNIPYNISGLIMRKLPYLKPLPAQVTLLVQKEVGDRLASRPPNLHLSGLVTQLWGKTHHLLTVPPSCFWPPPKVKSSLIAIIPLQKQLSSVERENIIKTAKPFHQHKRKQIQNTLKNYFHLPPQEIHHILHNNNINPLARPQELSLSQWRALTRVLY